MTDRIFGDHLNRNVVKNPLLSTAVTGLSIEDLTHNAVLLPVSVSQEATTRSDQQAGTQLATSRSTENAVSFHAIGDANANLYPLTPPPLTTPTPPAQQNTQKTQETTETIRSTVSKASLKSDDNFDVNEYFARLHGTRYVSAPLNTELKEDLAAEENLEEINLKEPETDVQQSLTADIAQNFSQLPAVLPQMASAVFSSFSSMLQTRMSREVTPEVSGYQEVLERTREPQMSQAPPREPPKEPLGAPPSCGTANYRLPPKKKYAQIPGLLSGDIAQSRVQQYPPMSQPLPPSSQVPQFFTPSSIPEQNLQDYHANIPPSIASQSAAPTYFTPENPAQIQTDYATDAQKPIHAVKNQGQNIPEIQRSEDKIETTRPPIHQYNLDSPAHSVLPPPPMFANQPRTDSQTTVGKGVLPPSVARRIGTNQPIINQTTNIPSFTQNIFIPAPVDTQAPQETIAQQVPFSQYSAASVSSAPPVPSVSAPLAPSFSAPPATPFSAPLAPSFSAPPATPFSAPLTPSFFVSSATSLSANIPINTPPTSIPMMPSNTGIWPKPPDTENKTSIFPPSIPTKEQPIKEKSSQSLNQIQIAATATSSIPPLPPSQLPPNPMSSSTALPSHNFQASYQEHPPTIFNPSAALTSPLSPETIFPPSSDQVSKNPPQINMPTSIQASGNIHGSLPPPPTFFNPSAEIKEFPPINNPATPTPEPPKPILEPPKSAGNISYRMTKKRPQYYSGPIEGVGAISNNVKPVITPVHADPFQGAMFTPQQTGSTPTQVTQNIEASAEQSPFNISRPVEPFYSNVAAQPQAYPNTAFDMSRPSTESYSDTKQESTGFGLLGSLKSKLGSLDINKIQNTVTTFFDPTYNDSKKVSGNIHEHYSQQQFGQLDQTKSSNFEVFVPNMEQATPAYNYDYQTSYNTHYGHNPPPNPYSTHTSNENYDQTQYDHNPPLHTLSAQTNESYNLNQAQAAGNYFTDTDMHRYQDTGTDIAQVQAPRSQEEINASRQPDIEIQHTFSNQQPHSFIDKDRQVLDSQMAINKSDSINSEMLHVENLQKVSSQQAHSFFDTQPPLTIPTKIVDSQIATNKSNSINSEMLHVENLQKVSSQQAHSFFDTQPPLTIPTKIVDSQIATNKSNSINSEMLHGEHLQKVSSQQAHSFFDTQSQFASPLQTLKSPAVTKKIGSIETLDAQSITHIGNIPNSAWETVAQTLPPKDLVKDNQPIEKAPVVAEAPMEDSVEKPPIFTQKENVNMESKLNQNISQSEDSRPNIDVSLSGYVENPQKYTTHETSQRSATNLSDNFFDKPISQIIPSEISSYQHLNKSDMKLPDFEVQDVLGASASFFEYKPADGIPLKSTFEPSFSIKGQKYATDRFDSNRFIAPNLQSNASDFFSSLNPADTKIQSIFSSAFDFNKSEGKEDSKNNNDIITEWPEETRPLEMSSAPLYGLSTMLANKTKELNELEDEIRNVVIQELSKDDDFAEDLKKGNSELNICETCREVNKPEDWVRDETDDLTTQLIENITSPIQLSNPVEVPLTESNTPADDREDFNTTQCEEISHITEETIEAIQIQTATEMLDDDQKPRDYGWATDEAPHAEKVERDCTFEQPTGLEQHNYSLPVNPNAIGFFGSNPLFEEIPNKLKTDFEKQENITRVLPRQMSIPSAPPAEDDTKSEGLDVHSIEQDASKDFPIFEEYVIEPDEIANDSDEDRPVDKFSNRVDKFKKIEDVVKGSPAIITSTSPSMTIASYFDTGNYAAETHYRNSLTSPTTAFSFSSNQVSVPPGFEEEFHRKLSTQDGQPESIEPSIPDTTTQTRLTFTATVSTSQDMTTYVTTASTIYTTPLSENVNLPNFSDVFGAVKNIIKESEPIGDANIDVFEVKKEIQPGNFDNVFDVKKDVMPGASVMKTPEFELEPRSLPDPLNFFASNTEAHTDTQDQGFNRLASYFSSPPKTDHSKSFFELSESQNHYRQETKVNKGVTQIENNNHQNIPQDQYVANLSLMRDLTTRQPDFKPEQVVRTINYFTIEYDDVNFVQNVINTTKITNEVKFESVNNESDVIDNKVETTEDETLLPTLNSCVNDFETVGTILPQDSLDGCKVKQCMDSVSENKMNDMDAGNNSMDKPDTVTVNVDQIETQEESDDGVIVTSAETRGAQEYTPVQHHWFYRVDVDGKSIWRGFSAADSQALENAFLSPDLNENTVVATDGGRFDVNVKGRLRVPVYWSEKPTNVMRCSWFYKGTTDARFVPYSESVAEKLEEEYRHGIMTGEWHRRLVLPHNEMVVMHGPAVMVHFVQAASDAFSTPPMFAFSKRVYRNLPKIRLPRDQKEKIDHLILLVHGAGEYRHQKQKLQSMMRPRVVRRGHDESEIENVEPSSVDHLLLLCHGVGSACDMRFRNVEEVVDEFRATSLQLIQSHYKSAYDSGNVGRVEVLPISWHDTLHSGETGVDRRLARITLDSIPRLRNFTNDTVLDVLFYTSPVYCQTIINTVCAEMNRIYKLFRLRNPDFKGGVSLGGHSLGSVILYDLLNHQTPQSPEKSDSKQYAPAAGGGGRPRPPHVVYPSLDFAPTALYALGSPIAIFECIRGVDQLGLDFRLPTCKHLFNIFHPYDPIAYRIEPLVNPALRDVKPELIPHHKGRKRMHLELKDTMARVGADLKQKLLESIRNTWSSVWGNQAAAPSSTLEKVVEEELEKEPMADQSKEEASEEKVPPYLLGRLNSGRRVDYVLQEAPFEMINEYLFAMTSHVCYWESEDTMLLMLREIYDSLGVSPDSTVPQNTLTVQRTLPNARQQAATVFDEGD